MKSHFRRLPFGPHASTISYVHLCLRYKTEGAKINEIYRVIFLMAICIQTHYSVTDKTYIRLKLTYSHSLSIKSISIGYVDSKLSNTDFNKKKLSFSL